MEGTYDLRLVALSYGIAVLAAYVALDLASRIIASQGAAAIYWLAGGAFAMGTGIWSMHFIGMLAFKLPVPMSYDTGITVASLLIAILVSGFALYTINRNSLSATRLLMSGLLMGIGITCMHYTGMFAMQMSPSIQYDPVLFAASVVIAIAASIAALAIAYRLRSGRIDHLTLKRFSSALIMGVAIAGMHFTGMAAAHFSPDSVCLSGPQQLSDNWLSAIIAVCTVALLTITLMISIFDARLTSHTEALAESLRKSEKRFRSLIETGRNAITLLDVDGKVLYRSQETARIFGYAMVELKKQTALELIHPDDLPIAQNLLQIVIGNPTTPATAMMRFRHGDGEWHWLESTATNLLNQPEVAAIAINSSDVTERKNQDQKIAKLSRIKSVLDAINSAILHCRDRESLLNETCRIAIENGKFKMIWIGALDYTRTNVTPVAWSGMDDELAKQLYIRVLAETPKNEGTIALAVRNAQASIDNDFARHPGDGPIRRHAREHGVQSVISLPLVIDGEIKDVFSLYAEEVGYFTEDETQLIEQMVSNVSLSLERMTQQKKLDKLSRVRAVSTAINATIIRSRDKQQLFEEACHIATGEGKFGIAWIGIYDQARQELTPAAISGLENDTQIAYEKLILREGSPQRNGMLGTAIRERRAVFNNNIVSDAALGGNRRKIAVSRGYHSVIGLPLIVGTDVFGSMSMFAEERDFFDEAEVNLLTGLASNISLALERMAQQESIKKLSHSQVALAQSLRNANGKLQQIYKTMPGAVIIFDASGTIKSVNDAAVALLEHTEEEMLGQPLSKMFDASSLPTITEIESAVKDNAVFRAEKLCRNEGGDLIPVLYSATRIGNTNSNEHDYICVALDIREQKQLEVELRQAQKLESVGRLAAGVAHEINTPIQFVGDSVQFVMDVTGDLERLIQTYQSALQAISGGASPAGLLEDAARLEAEIDLDYIKENVPKSLARALEGISRVAEIVRAMKEFAHPDQKEMTAIDLNQSILSTLTIAKNEYKYVAEVETELCELPRVTCHAGEVNQAILNVVVNAAHAIGDVVKNTTHKGLIRVLTRHEDNDVVVSISDTGGGIPEAIRERIFDPFFTTKEVGRGTGQGLAISRSVVCEKHGGNFTFDTELGKGTTFFIRLPINGRPQRNISGALA